MIGADTGVFLAGRHFGKPRDLTVAREMLGGLADVRVYDVRLARIQAAISRADARMGRLLIAWARAGGGLGGWRRALRRNGVAEESLLKPPKLDGEVPWNRVRTSTSHMLRMIMNNIFG